MANQLQDKPAFRWWVNFVLRKQGRIVNEIKKRHWKMTHEFGIKLPHSVDEALEIDRKTRTAFWADAIKKEMDKIKGMGAVEPISRWTPDQLRANSKPMPGFKEIGLHMAFDIKMDGKFTGKAQIGCGWASHLMRSPSATPMRCCGLARLSEAGLPLCRAQ